MSLTYLLMLSFIFITAWCLGQLFGTWWFGRWNKNDNRKRHAFALVYATLATFFFYEWW